MGRESVKIYDTEERKEREMPQLDVTTFFGQVTWFAVVFVVFYLVMVSDVLPRLNRAVKVRAKKLELTRGDARQFDAERVSTEESYARSLMGAAGSSVSLLMGCQETQSAWSSEAVSSLREGDGSPERSGAHVECLEAIADTQASSFELATLMNEVELTDEQVMEDPSRRYIQL